MLKHNSHTFPVSKGTIYTKNADIGTIKEVLVLKDIFCSTTYGCVLMNQIKSFQDDPNDFQRDGGGILSTSLLIAKPTPKKPTYIRVTQFDFEDNSSMSKIFERGEF